MSTKTLLISSVLSVFLLFMAVGRCPADVTEQFKQAGDYIQNKQYEQAEAIYQQIVTDFPGSDYALEAQKQLTILYIKQDNQPQADAAFQKLLADFYLHNDIAKAVNKVADHYGWSGKYEKARQLYQYVVGNWPQADYAIWSQKSLAASNMRLGDDPNADAAIEKLLTDFSRHKQIANAVNMLADECSTLKRYDKARELYQYVADNCPENELAIWAQQGVAILSIKLGDFAAAKDEVEKLLTDFSEHKHIAKAVNKVADHYRWSKRYEKARQLYQYFVENFPDSDSAIWAQQGVAISNIKLRDDDAAQYAVEKLITDFSEHKDIAKAVNKAADHYRWSKKYEEARRLYQYVVDNWPQAEYAIWSQKSLAVSNMRLGDDPNADAAIEKLLTDYSEHKQIANALNMLADECTMLNRFDKAFELYQYVIDRRPEDKYAKRSEMEIAKTNVLSLIKLGDDAAAMDALDILIADFNDQPELVAAIFQVGEEYYNKALSYKKEANEIKMKEYFSKAIDVWERIITELPESNSTAAAHAHYFASVCYRRLGEYAIPIKYCQRIVDMWPDYRYIWHAKSMIKHCLKSLEKSEPNP